MPRISREYCSIWNSLDNNKFKKPRNAQQGQRENWLRMLSGVWNGRNYMNVSVKTKIYPTEWATSESMRAA